MLELRNLTKWYQTPLGRRYVFRDLNFKFPDNASIGLLGRNGAGKSTLLRLLGGIDTPNAGAVVTDARISWPVGLSGGFQNALTARENLQFICRVHGATGPAMRRILDFVADFAEIGDYFDLPISSYSSGMRARVAFGASMAFEFDYYLIDELMAVGDPQFRQKSQRLLRERLQRAKVIMVSHNTKEILRICDVVVLVDRGNTVLYEDVRAGVHAYLKQAEPDRPGLPEATAGAGVRPVAVAAPRPLGALPGERRPGGVPVKANAKGPAKGPAKDSAKAAAGTGPGAAAARPRPAGAGPTAVRPGAPGQSPAAKRPAAARPGPGAAKPGAGPARPGGGPVRPAGVNRPAGAPLRAANPARPARPPGSAAVTALPADARAPEPAAATPTRAEPETIPTPVAPEAGASVSTAPTDPTALRAD